MKVVLQSEIAECGLACAASIANHYGCPVTLADLRQQGYASSKGHNFFQLVILLKALGIEAKGGRMPVDKLGELNEPAILHWNNNHFVVLDSVSENSITIMDPAAGRVKVPNDAFVTQVIKADASGVFSYTMPRAGWWGFAALVEGEGKMKSPDGEMVDVELGGLMWVKTVDME